jgi:hypothetical protein
MSVVVGEATIHQTLLGTIESNTVTRNYDHKLSSNLVEEGILVPCPRYQGEMKDG